MKTPYEIPPVASTVFDRLCAGVMRATWPCFHCTGHHGAPGDPDLCDAAITHQRRNERVARRTETTPWKRKD